MLTCYSVASLLTCGPKDCKVYYKGTSAPRVLSHSGLEALIDPARASRLFHDTFMNYSHEIDAALYCSSSIPNKQSACGNPL